MSHVKLQLEVNLKSNMIIGGQRALESYHLFITFLDKDDSFESSYNNPRYIIHSCKNDFKIRSVWDEPFGAITDNGLMIPKLDKVGFELKKTFTTENDRYVFLKKVYDALLDWANNWEGFKYDSESTIKLDGNIWTVSCARRNVRTERKHYHTTKELMKRNIFF